MSVTDSERPVFRHRGPERRLGLVESLRVMQDNVVDLYPPYIFDKDWSVRRFAFQTFIILNRPDLIKEMLVDKTDIYSKGRLNRQILGPALGNGLLTSEGDFWKRQRRIAAPAFHFRKLQVLADIMVDCAEALNERWEEHADTDRHVDIAHEMMRMTMEIVARTLFSSDIVRDIDRLGDAIGILIGNLGRLSTIDLLGLPEWMPRFRDPRVKEALRTLDEMILGMIENRRGEGEGAREDLLQMLLDARDPENGEGMSDRQLRDEVLTLFAAGHETTAQALTWAFYLLSQHPEEEAKFHAELDAELGDRRQGFDDIRDLQRTRMIFEETLRLFPPAFSISRTAEKADRLGGELAVPKGAIVSASPYITHRNPKLWPNSELFDPERFADHEVHGRHKHAYFPFGAGQRICIGSGFAQIEGQLALAVIGRKYRLRLKQGHPVHPQGRVTLRPRFGMRMRIEKR
ncbi:MAG: cytochrome P450 [Minwuia sp.]|uniref:cytochrome P450 n=1 Tax=Minwuia sp. TaxID=2493630 RepID=UPI003A8B62E8